MRKKAKKRLANLLLTATALTIFVGASVAWGQEEPANPYTKIITEASDEELRELEAIMYLECRGESWEGQLATIQTTLNRVMYPDFGNTIHDVLSEKIDGYRQYTTWKDISKARPGEEQSDLIEFICNCNVEELPLQYTDYVFFSTNGRDGVERKKIDNQYFSRSAKMDGRRLY